MDTIGKRLTHVREGIAKLNQTDFSKILGGDSHGLVSSLEKEKTQLRPTHLKILREKYNVSSDWLLFGTEPMLLGDMPVTDWKDEAYKNALSEVQYLRGLVSQYLTGAKTETAQLGKVKGNRMPIGTSKPRAAIMNVEKENEVDVTKTVTNALKAERRA